MDDRGPPHRGARTDEAMSVAVPAEPGITIRGLRREEYDQLVEMGVFEGERIELLGGALIEMNPQGSPHGWVIERLTATLMPLAEQYSLRIQLPLAIDEISEPEPDVAITDRTTPDAHPARAHVAIEVTASSHALDLGELLPE